MKTKTYEELDLRDRIRLDRAKDVIRDIAFNDDVWRLYKKWFRENYKI